MEKAKFRIKYNAPVTLTFAFICLLVLGLGNLSGNNITRTFFEVYRSKMSFTWFIRLFGHSLGHINFDHLFGKVGAVGGKAHQDSFLQNDASATEWVEHSASFGAFGGEVN